MPQPVWTVIDAVTNGSGIEPWDDDVTSDDPLGFTDTLPYADRLALARDRSGLTEAVVTGRAHVGDHDVVLIAGAFEFLAGTLGVASAERVVRAFDRAADLRLPVIGLPTSGGTRMQEGTLGFVQMATCAAAVRRFRDAGLPYVAWLRHPTTGGVLASWASLATVTFAEPGALIGMIGPRVIEALTGEAFPDGVQTAENLLAHGLVDDIVPLADLPERIARVLAVTSTPPAPWDVEAAPLELEPGAEIDGWTAVQRSRRVDRPGIRELLEVSASHITELHGDGAGRDDLGCLVALARVCGVPAVVIGHDRPAGVRGARLDAAGYRKARLGMELAQQLSLPVVTVIDTAGAKLTPEAESGGLAREIAKCLATMTGLTAPTLSLLLGEGSGGGALALLPADRVIAAQHAWLAPISPEGASVILFRSPDRAAELANAQATSSTALRRLGIVDVVVPDRPPALERGQPFAERIAATAAHELSALLNTDPDERRRVRAHRFRPLLT